MEPIIDLTTDHLVVVSVGTDHHPFDRLMRWVDHYLERRPVVRFVVQYGTSRIPAGAFESHDLVPHQELRQLFARSTAVVCHGGPSTVMDARTAGRLPIVVPRRPDLGEHVDGHQLRFATHLVEEHMARVAWSESAFMSLLDSALDNPGTYRLSGGVRPMPAGVVRLAQRLDDLLDTSTPLEMP